MTDEVVNLETIQITDVANSPTLLEANFGTVNIENVYIENCESGFFRGFETNAIIRNVEIIDASCPLGLGLEFCIFGAQYSNISISHLMITSISSDVLLMDIQQMDDGWFTDINILSSTGANAEIKLYQSKVNFVQGNYLNFQADLFQISNSEVNFQYITMESDNTNSKLLYLNVIDSNITFEQCYLTNYGDEAKVYRIAAFKNRHYHIRDLEIGLELLLQILKISLKISAQQLQSPEPILILLFMVSHSHITKLKSVGLFILMTTVINPEIL